VHTLRVRFLGTRGEIEARSKLHGRHSALLIERAGRRVVIDCGGDWLGRLDGIGPDAVLVTHAHDDHAAGLKHGAPCPVYATADAWRTIRRYPVDERVEVAPHTPLALLGLEVEAVPVEHSLRAPAVGYRVDDQGSSLFYAPDLVSISAPEAALRGLSLYIGDGASLTRAIVRRRDGARIGHASIREQLDWCAAEGVPWAVFTHCGSQIVRAEPAAVAAVVASLGRERSVRAEIAHDGLILRLSRRLIRAGTDAPRTQTRQAEPPAQQGGKGHDR
jgi:phosphoribosyl 1,2-cyclic phosphodiesterase